MILSKIDDKLTIYKNKEIVLFGASSAGLEVKHFLEKNNISIKYFCDNNLKKQNTYLEHIKIISVEKLCQLYHNNMLIQISSEYSKEIEQQLNTLHLYSFITYDEYIERISGLIKYKFFKGKKNLKKIYMEKANIFGCMETTDEQPIWNYIAKAQCLGYDSINILCLPPKTGDWTLNASIKQCHGEFVNFWHTYRHMIPQLKEIIKDKKIKIITAVREPISQNISEFFQMCNCFWDISEYWDNGGDVQYLFNQFIKHELNENFGEDSQIDNEVSFFNHYKNAEKLDYVIQNFFENQFEKFSGIDIYQYPFDVENGYSVIKQNNIEIFIYQLEKLNELTKPLGDFLEIENLILINDNLGESKWYANAYREAKKAIKFSEKYYKYCYDSKYTKHFYSPKDIKIFKDKWISHVEG